MGKGYSYSQMAMYERCGIQYRKRYVENRIAPPGVSMIRGRGAHKGREANLTQKKDSGEDLPLSDVLDAARDEVNLGFQGDQDSNIMKLAEYYHDCIELHVAYSYGRGA